MTIPKLKSVNLAPHLVVVGRSDVERLARLSPGFGYEPARTRRVPDIVIQAMIRHENVSTTQRSYTRAVPEVVTVMKRLEAQIAVQQEKLKRFGKLKKQNEKPT